MTLTAVLPVLPSIEGWLLYSIRHTLGIRRRSSQPGTTPSLNIKRRPAIESQLFGIRCKIRETFPLNTTRQLPSHDIHAYRNLVDSEPLNVASLIFGSGGPFAVHPSFSYLEAGVAH